MINDLPRESAGVREHRKLVDDVSADFFWEPLTTHKLRLLTLEVAPLLRFLPGVDLEATAYRAQVLEWVLATAAGDTDGAEARAERLRESIARLPPQHPDVAPHTEKVSRLRAMGWAHSASLDDLDDLESIAVLMRHRLREGQHVITLDLQDAFREQKWIAVGPGATEFDAVEYREQAEARVRELATTHPAMLKLTTGQSLDEGDVTAIEDALNAPDLYITTESLQSPIMRGLISRSSKSPKRGSTRLVQVLT